MNVRKPQHITFTGVDDKTNVQDLLHLSARYPVEWGVLFSPTRQGTDPRYPGGEKLSELLWSGLPMAAHLCGQHSRNIMAGKSVNIPADLFYFQRIQVNSSEPDSVKIDAFRRGWGVKDAIGQCRGQHFPEGPIQWLYDCSGGKGLSPPVWPRHPGGDRLVGYAGGIGPHNVSDVIGAIDASGPYWIDMESRVRTDDIFDIGLCWRVCELVYGKPTMTEEVGR